MPEREGTAACRAPQVAREGLRSVVDWPLLMGLVICSWHIKEASLVAVFGFKMTLCVNGYCMLPGLGGAIR